MEERVMTPADFYAILKRRKWSLILPAIVVLLIAAAVALLLPAVYRSSATILIEEQEIPQEFVMTTVTSFAEQRIQQINQRIMSTSRLVGIIQGLNLYPGLKGKRTTEELVEKMREDTALDPISAEVIDRRTGRPATATIAFELSYQGKNPKKVQQVANTLTSLLLEENLKERVKQVAETSEFLESEMERVKAELAGLEKRIADFKEKHISELPEMMAVNQQSLNNIERAIESANERRRSLGEREGFLQAQLASVNPHLEEQEGINAMTRLKQLRLELVNYEERFTDKHPDIIRTRAEIKRLEEEIAAGGSLQALPNNPAYITLSAQLASTQAEMASIERQIADMKQQQQQFRERVGATPRVEEEYNSLMIAKTNTQAKYNDLMQKVMEAKVAHGLEKEQKGERFVLIDPPLLPQKPFKPNRLAIVLIGFVLGVGAGVGFAALREFSDDTVRSVDQLEAAVGLPVLTGVPVILTGKDISSRRWKRVGLAAAVVAVAVVAVALFHYQVMDLDVFWAKLMRKLAL
jgi:polysaccharide chain length determinant protein (PEP-CTERM system associated)